MRKKITWVWLLSAAFGGDAEANTKRYYPAR